MQDILFRSTIGSLMYLAVCTRPDISAAVNSLSRFNGDPSLMYWEGVLHVLKFLKGTMESVRVCGASFSINRARVQHYPGTGPIALVIM